MMAIAQKFDVAGRDARNRALGRAGEERILHHELLTLKMAGQDSLARKVRWVSEEDGDGAGYDIHSFVTDGADRLIEVKTTNGWERTPFRISLPPAARTLSRESGTKRRWNRFALGGPTPALT